MVLVFVAAIAGITLGLYAEFTGRPHLAKWCWLSLVVNCLIVAVYDASRGDTGDAVVDLMFAVGYAVFGWWAHERA